MRPSLKKIAPLAAVMFSGLAMGHGWTEFPKARQTYCADQGGYWSPPDGSGIPNAACRAAFGESGTYPFVQKNEFAANIADYTNQEAVQRTVTNGNLCSAGDSRKSGLDIPSADWQKTLLTPGTHTLRFRGTAPHRPSFWRIYLSRPGFDSATQRLNWSDLELINSYDDLPVVDGFFEMDVNIPEGRTGTGILYVRWQRYDPVGEGFYNCSDIQFEPQPTPVQEPEPDPTPVQEPEPQPQPEPQPGPEPTPTPSLNNIGNYVTADYNIAAVGDMVRFRLFDRSGQEVVDEYLEITSDNVEFSRWTRDLALKVNDRNQGQVFIGIWHTSMGHYMYNEDNVFTNQVWAAEGYTSSVSVGVEAPAPEPTLTYDYVYPDGLGDYQPGTRVLGQDGSVYQCKPFPYSGWCNIDSALYYAPGSGIAWEDPWVKLN